MRVHVNSFVRASCASFFAPLVSFSSSSSSITKKGERRRSLKKRAKTKTKCSWKKKYSHHFSPSIRRLLCCCRRAKLSSKESAFVVPVATALQTLSPVRIARTPIRSANVNTALKKMGCASSKSVEPPTGLNDAAGRNEEEYLPNAVSAETKDEDEEAIVMFDARENHPTLAVLDDTRANDIVYVYLQSFRLRHQNGARAHKEEEDKGPPQLREYVCELMIRKKTGGRGNKEDDTNDYRDEWIPLGTKILFGSERVVGAVSTRAIQTRRILTMLLKI